MVDICTGYDMLPPKSAYGKKAAVAQVRKRIY